MIDKLQISTSDFSVEDDSQLRIHPASFLVSEEQAYSGGGVLYQVGNRFRYGAKASMHSDKFDLTIKPGFGMELHFNPAVVIHQNNFIKVTEEEFRQSLDVVSDAVLDSGVLFDLSSSNITRLDIASDREMNESFSNYAQLFRMLKAKRAKPKELENGYYFANGNRTLVFYDKVAQAFIKYGNNPDNPLGYWMRGEYRLCTKDAVKRFAGFDNIASIRNVSFGDLGKFYQNSIQDFVFGSIPKPETQAFSLSMETEILKSFREEFGRGALNRYHETRINLARFGSIENYRAVLLDAGFGKSYVSKVERAVRQSLSIIDLIEAQNGKPSIGRLYEEIYNKFIKQAA